AGREAGGGHGAILAVVNGIFVSAAQAFAVALPEFVAIAESAAIGLVGALVLRRAFDGARPAPDLVVAVGHPETFFVTMHEPMSKNGLLQQRLLGAASALSIQVAGGQPGGYKEQCAQQYCVSDGAEKHFTTSLQMRCRGEA